jgi:hypothetical protein
MNVNAPLMLKTLDHIHEHPEEYDQGEWAARTACGTTACFAGTAVMIAGYDFDFRVYEDVNATDKLTNGQFIREVARQELGLTMMQADALFYGGNTLKEVENLVSLIIDGVEVPRPVIHFEPNGMLSVYASTT